MTIEQSHGKARPTLPRSNELRVVQTARDPSEGRAAGGRFAPGNRLAFGAKWKATVKKLLGRAVDNATAEVVGRDAWKIYLATLRSMPSDDAPVRSLVAIHARHVAVASYFTNLAAEAGLESERGLGLLEVASHHGARAERTIVTAVDVATKLASKPKPKTDPLARFMPGAPK
jgi:hypothetical protein